MNAVEMKEYGYRFVNATSPDMFSDPDDAPFVLIAPDGQEITKVQAESEIASGFWRERHINAQEVELIRTKPSFLSDKSWIDTNLSYIDLMKQSTRYYQVIEANQYDRDIETFTRRAPYVEFESVKYNTREVKVLYENRLTNHMMFRVVEFDTPQGTVLAFSRF